MIATEAQRLIELIDHKVHLKENVDLRQGFKSRQDELTQAVSDLEWRLETIRELCVRGSLRPDVQIKAAAFLNQVIKAQSEFESDPSRIINFNMAPFNSALKALIQGLDGYISKEWQSYTGRARHGNVEVLNVLGAIPTFSSIVQKIKGLAAQIDILRRKNPRSKPDLETFDKLVAQMEKAWGKLHSEDVPSSVIEFLKASGSHEGALLDHLTDEVQEWVKSRKIEDSFRIYLKPQEI